MEHYGEGPGPSGGTYKSSPTQIPGTNWSTSDKHLMCEAFSSSAIKTDGTLWVMGSGWYGSLGLNNTGTYYSSPVQVGTDTTWSDISGSTSHAGRGIKTDGTLWVWGYNDATGQLCGALGLNDIINRSSPTQVPGTNWKECMNTPTATYAIKTDGTLWSWGMNQAGQLGLNQSWDQGGGNYLRVSSPAQVGTDTTWDTLPKGNRNATFFIGATKTDGTLWVWGRNDDGQLDAGLPTSPGANVHRSSPIQIPGTTWSEVRMLSKGFQASKTDGTLWSWGYQSGSGAGKLGQNSTINLSSPVQIPGTNWIDSPLMGGTNNSVFVKREG